MMVNNWEYGPGMDHGIGLDRLTGAARGSGIEVGEISCAGGPAVTFVVVQIESQDDLQRAVHGDAAVEAPHPGLTRAAGRAGFARRCHVNRYSAYLLVRVTAAHSFHEIREPRLTPRAMELLADGDWFRNEFGDAYVRGIVRGGELYGLIEFATGTDEQQQAIAGSLDNVCGTFGNGPDLTASLARSWALADRDLRTRVTTFQRGGNPRPAPDAAALFDWALAFADDISGRPVPYSAFLGEYVRLSPRARSTVDLEPARQALLRASRIRNEILTQLEDIDYYVAHPDQFRAISEADRTAIEVARRTLARQLNDVTRAAGRCASTARDCLSTTHDRLSTVDYPAYALPDRRGVLIMSRP